MAKKAARHAQAVTPEVIDVQERPEVALIRRESEPIAVLMQNMQLFFDKAQDLETRAQVELDRAMREWKTPTSRMEDEALVAMIRANNADVKELEQHWEVTTVLSRMHRSMTGLRNRALSLRDQIKNHGNALHSAYERKERERVEAEQREQRRQEEERQRQIREREQAEAEQKALEAEAASPTLGDREQRFVDLYMTNGNHAVNAARGAGYKDADANAVRLMKTNKILQAIESRRQALAIRQQASAKAAAPIAPTVTAPAPVAQVAAKSREYKSCEVVDPELFMAVLLDPKLRAMHRIPPEAATYVQSVLNDIARQIGDEINKIPGLRLKVTTSV